MSRNQKLFTLLIAVVAVLGLAGAVWAQTSSAVMSRSGTVIAKYDGKVAVKMDDGTTKEFSPAPGKTVMVNGVPTGYADLKVGTVLTADFVATTKTVPVTTTEIKDGTLIKIFPAGFIGWTQAEGYKQYDVPKGFRFLVDGKETELSSLREGMKLTATIVSVETKTETEKELVGDFLEVLSDALSDGVAVGGHKVKGFDLPMLVNRARVHRLRVPMAVLSFWKGRPTWHENIFDTLELLSFGRAFEGNGVEEVARVFGLPPKLGHGGDLSDALARGSRGGAGLQPADVEIEIEIARICGAI